MAGEKEPKEQTKGRPTTCTPKVVEDFVQLVRLGNHIRIVRVALGIPEDTFGDWKRFSKKVPRLKRYAIHRELFERLASARAEGEVANITIIARAARNGDVGSAKWLEERLGPERWGRVNPDGNSGPKRSDPYAELPGDELAAKRATQAPGQ